MIFILPGLNCLTSIHLLCMCLQMIAVVMDIFTDVDIFKDLIEAGFRKKVAIYIIIDNASVQHFLLMCERANMHRGHLNVS